LNLKYVPSYLPTPKEIENIEATVRNWRDHFLACGVSEKDFVYMAQAFLPECIFFETPPEE